MLGCDAELRAARALVRRNGALLQRAAAEDGGPRAVAAWLAEAYGKGL